MIPLSIPPNQAWLAIFLPALLYYTLLSPTNTPILSYLNLLPSYAPLNTTIHLQHGTQDEINKILISKSSFEKVIGNDSDAMFYDMTWVEDAELGRGYLLLSDSASSGKVWRYETGGGLVPIGKSLYLDHSGCRSNFWTSCKKDSRSGSKGLIVQAIRDEDRFDIGSLIIVEGGEKRIVRLEKDGARTPLVLNVPSLCNKNESVRLSSPGKVVYTPFGDLLFTETVQCREQVGNENETRVITKSGLFRIKDVVNIPSITFHQSRAAHKWTVEDMITEVAVEIAYIGMETISSVVVEKDAMTLLISGNRFEEGQGCRHVIYKVVDDMDDADGSTKNISDMQLFFDMSKFFPKQNICRGEDTHIAMTIDNQGNVFASYPGGIAIIDYYGELLVTVKIGGIDGKGSDLDMLANALTIGNDGYLYMSTDTTLQRYKIKSKMLEYPTNLIVPKKK
eukprot:scaffold1993_cov236-Chaetoceros_neogracile.AAC.9